MIPTGQPGTLRQGARRVLLTGAHRRVAGTVLQGLLEDDGVDFIVGVSEAPCPPALLGHDPARFTYVSANLSRRREVDNLFLLEQCREKPIDTVVHLAFQGNPKGYDFRRHEYNVNSARHLLDAALRHRVSKFVMLSSDAVYRVGPRMDYQVAEDVELNLDPDVHPIVRDTIDAEFICRAKMDHPSTEVVVLRPAGVLGGGVVSGLNLLFESEPPLLPVGFDPMINPTTKERLAADIRLSIMLHGKGVFNVAGPQAGPMSRYLEERGIVPRRLPGPLLMPAIRAQRLMGKTRYHPEFHPNRLHYSLVLDDGRFQSIFRDNAGLLEPSGSEVET
jgi:nucleoside-diphosphate-sugar epimerase